MDKTPHDGMRHDSQLRECPILTEGQLDAIAALAADRAVNRLYQEVGKSTVKFVLYVIGAACVAVAAWLGIVPKIK